MLRDALDLSSFLLGACAFGSVIAAHASRKAIEMGLTLSEYSLENKATGEKDCRQIINDYWADGRKSKM